MNPVAILLVSTGGMAGEILRWAKVCLGESQHCTSLCLSMDDSWDSSMEQLSHAIVKIDQGSGVLILTDMEGGTPFNLAKTLLGEKRVALIGGTNMPMLLKAIQLSTTLDLESLVDRVVDYGKSHIVRGGA